MAGLVSDRKNNATGVSFTSDTHFIIDRRDENHTLIILVGIEHFTDLL